LRIETFMSSPRSFHWKCANMTCCWIAEISHFLMWKIDRKTSKDFGSTIPKKIPKMRNHLYIERQRYTIVHSCLVPDKTRKEIKEIFRLQHFEKMRESATVYSRARVLWTHFCSSGFHKCTRPHGYVSVTHGAANRCDRGKPDDHAGYAWNMPDSISRGPLL